MSKKETCPMCAKHKQREEAEYKSLMNRLKRIEGQVRGIQGMLKEDAYCVDILVQVSAITAALNNFSKELLSEHMHSCVVQNLKDGNEEVIDELIHIFPKLMK